MLWFPPDTIFLPEKQRVRFENLLRMLGKNLKTVSLENGWSCNTLGKKVFLKKSKKGMQNVTSTNEIRNAVPYRKTLAKFRWKTFIDRFWYLSFLLLCFKYYFLFFSECNSVFWFLAEEDFMLKVCLIFCDNSLQAPVERLRTLISVAVLFNPRNTISCEIGSTIRLWAV